MDDTAEHVAEERAMTVQPDQGKDQVESILAQRGLQVDDDDDDDDDDVEEPKEGELDEAVVFQDEEDELQKEHYEKEDEIMNTLDGEEDGWDDLDTQFKDISRPKEEEVEPTDKELEAKQTPHDQPLITEKGAGANNNTVIEKPMNYEDDTTAQQQPVAEQQLEEATEETSQEGEVEKGETSDQQQAEPEHTKTLTQNDVPSETDTEQPAEEEPEQRGAEPPSTPNNNHNNTSKAASAVEAITPHRLTKMILPPTSRLRMAAAKHASPDRPKPPPPPPAPVKTFEKEYKQSLAREKEAQRETRTLRRHVMKLNNNLVNAEAEVEPLRAELQRAGARLDKDRKRHKEELEATKKRHADELAALKQQQAQTIQDIQARSLGQVEEVRKQLRNLEEQRAQEGGDWTKEMETKMQRELESQRKLSLLE